MDDSDNFLATLDFKPETYELETQSTKSVFLDQKTNSEKRSTYKSQESSQDHEKGSRCPLCILIKDTPNANEQAKTDEPSALLCITGGSDNYMPNETIKNQLKSGLFEIIKTTSIWIITEGINTAVGNIVEEAIRENTGKYEIRVFHKDKKRNQPKDTSKEKDQHYPENCIKNRPITPLIMIVVGGEAKSFHLAMSYLKRHDPVLAIDGSGCAADFICQGYTMSMHKTSDDKTFKSELTDTAKTIWGDDQGMQTKKWEKLADELYIGLKNNRKFIHVHSVIDTTYTLDRTIQDIIFQLIVSKGKHDMDKILHFVDIWNRPDIAKQHIFNLENRKVLQKMQKEEDSYLSKLFTNSLMHNRIESVKLVLEYMQDKEFYKKFLDKHLDFLYTKAGCMAGFMILQQKQLKEMNIVANINKTVIKILGSKDFKPFKRDNQQDEIQVKDVFKHFFIWAVLMDRRELAMLFWKKLDNEYIYSALYASSLAKRLAKNGRSELYVDQMVALRESSRHYENLAYSVMTELYYMDKNQARQLLDAQMKGYSSSTIFQITEKFTLMKFMGHVVCQTQLNRIWKGQISGYTSILKVIAAAFIPILIMNIVITDARTKQTDQQQKDQEETSNETSSQSAVKCPIWMGKIYCFYNSPLIKFLFFVLAYMTFLVVFCLFVLTDLYPMSEKTPSVQEYIVYAWAASTMVEEIRQAFVFSQVSLNLMTWFSFWTLYEILMYSMFITSVILRLTLSAEDFYYARMMFAITLGLFIINSMQFFLVSKHIGPKVIMIGRMMFDIIFFILLFAVFLFGFGVIYQATMYPNSEPGFQLFKEIIYMPYWQLYGELFLDQYEGKEPSSCTNDVMLYRNGTFVRCPEVNQINTVVLAIYMVLSHIILVNILIAMFSNTFTKVQDNNELVWKFHRYSLIREYYDRSSLLPPLIIISYFKRTLMYIFKKYKKRNEKYKIKSTVKNTDAASTKLTILEKNAVYSYFNSSAQLRRDRAKNIETEKDWLEASYEEHEEDTESSMQAQFNLLSSEVDIIQKNQEETLEEVEKIMAETQKIKEETQQIKAETQQIKAAKERLMLVEVPKGTQGKSEGTYSPVEVEVPTWPFRETIFVKRYYDI